MTVVACVVEVGAGSVGSKAKQERITSHGAFSANVATKIAVYKVGVLFFIIRSFTLSIVRRAWLRLRQVFKYSV